MFEINGDEKILLTGGTGFLGSYLVKRLLSQGITPMVLTRNPQTRVFENQHGNPNFVTMDLLDVYALKNFLEIFRPTIIIHLAGYTYRLENHPHILEEFNFEATARLLDLANS